MFPDTTSQPSGSTGTTQPAQEGDTADGSATAADGGSDLLMEIGTLVVVGVLVGFVVLVRRWLMLRSRQPHPGLPPERVLPLSPHARLHDPKYLGRIVDLDEPPSES